MSNVRDSPEWQQARRDYIDDQRPGEVDEDDVYARRVEAAFPAPRNRTGTQERPTRRMTREARTVATDPGLRNHLTYY